MCINYIQPTFVKYDILVLRCRGIRDEISRLFHCVGIDFLNNNNLPPCYVMEISLQSLSAAAADLCAGQVSAAVGIIGLESYVNVRK